jgi:hypothetical protein
VAFDDLGHGPGELGDLWQLARHRADTEEGRDRAYHRAKREAYQQPVRLSRASRYRRSRKPLGAKRRRLQKHRVRSRRRPPSKCSTPCLGPVAAV